MNHTLHVDISQKNEKSQLQFVDKLEYDEITLENSNLTEFRILSEFSLEKYKLYVFELPVAHINLQNQQLAFLLSGFLNQKNFGNLAPTDKTISVSVIDRFESDSNYYVIVQSSLLSQHTLSTAATILARHHPPFDCDVLEKLLTPREQEIICLIAVGLSNKQVASRLDISIWTVSAHLRRIFQKLKVDTRAAVVYRCSPLLQG